MPIEVLMPALSPTMTEGNLAKWLKKEGDKVKPGEVIAEIETDKATMEVEAVDAGTLGKILVEAGSQNVMVNSPIAIILATGENASTLANYTVAAGTASPTAPATEAAKSEAATVANNNAQANTPSASTKEGDRIKASPLAKRVASELNLNLNNVKGSGPHGRIIKRDVLEASSTGASQSSSTHSIAAPSIGRIEEEYITVPNSTMRKVIAKRLLESKQNVPHFYLSVDCRMDNLLAARAQMNAAAGKDNPAYKLSVNDMVIKAVAMALRKVPEANASWTEEAILQYTNVDISVAVAIEGGLITPIIRNADQKPLSHLSNEMKSLAKKAREGKLAPHEFQGGGFSISNLGMYGVKNFQAIINPPQSCILAIGASEERAIIENGQVKAATIMEVTLSCDHRVVDGAVGAEFLKKFKEHIENPIIMLV